MIRRLFALPPRVVSGDVSGQPDRPTGASTPATAAELERNAGAATIADAQAYCECFARSRWSEYTAVARLVPPAIQPDLWAACAFARSVDDIADEPASEGRRLELLDAWEDQLRRAWHGEADDPVFIALADTAQRRELPIVPFLDMLAAYRMDLHVRRYPTFAALHEYLERAAAPLGRILLYLFGYGDPVRHRHAADLSIALCLTHVLSDLQADAARGRVYLPQEDLAYFGVSDADLLAGGSSPALRDLLHFEVARVRTFFLRGRPLLDRLEGPLHGIASVLWRRGRQLLDELEPDRASGVGLLARPDALMPAGAR